MSKKLAVLSDTHGLLRTEVLEGIKDADAILHAGDINRREILDQLAQIASIYVVRGNNDREWAEKLARLLEFEIDGKRICMTHNKKDLPQDLSLYDLVVFGHSHKYLEQKKGKTILLNPGSCGKRRFDQEITYAIVTIDKGEMTVEKIVIPQA